MTRSMLWILTFVTLLLVSGCSGLLAPKILPHPDAPIVVVKTFGGLYQAAVYDLDSNSLIPVGWYWMRDYRGWTLHKYDWDKHIRTQSQLTGGMK